MSEEIRDLLKKNHMSVTDSRLQILELFYHAPGALAHADIEKKASDKIDRVTIYRTLQTFEEKGIIHNMIMHSNRKPYFRLDSPKSKNCSKSNFVCSYSTRCYWEGFCYISESYSQENKRYHVR